MVQKVSALVNVPHELEKGCILLLLDGVFYRCPLAWLISGAFQIISILPDFLLDLSITDRGVLESPAITVGL